MVEERESLFSCFFLTKECTFLFATGPANYPVSSQKKSILTERRASAGQDKSEPSGRGRRGGLGEESRCAEGLPEDGGRVQWDWAPEEWGWLREEL